MLVAGSQPAAVPGDRGRRRASRPVASRRRRGEAREAREDQRVPRQAVRVLPREAAGDAGRRRLAARSMCVIMYGCGISDSNSAPAHRSADPGRRRRAAARSRAGVTCGCPKDTPLTNLQLTLLGSSVSRWRSSATVTAASRNCQPSRHLLSPMPVTAAGEDSGIWQAAVVQSDAWPLLWFPAEISPRSLRTLQKYSNIRIESDSRDRD